MNTQTRRIGLAAAVFLGVASHLNAIQQQRPTGAVEVAGRIVALLTNGPVPESHVLIVERTLRGRLIRTVRANPDGTFNVAGVPRGSYLIARGKGHGSKHLLVSEALDNVRFVLEESATLSGHVTDDFGAPIANATVRLTYLDADLPFLIAADIGETRTRANGEFTITHVNPAERFVVEAVSDVHPVGLSLPWILAPAQRQSGVHVVLTKGARLEIKVADAENGDVLRNAIVTLQIRSRTPLGPFSIGTAESMQRRPKLSDTGAMVFEAVLPGNYVVSAALPGYGTYTRGLDLLAGESKTIQVSLNRR